MNVQNDSNADMPAEIDFTGGARGKFHKAGTTLNLPVYLDPELQSRLSRLAIDKGVDIATLVNGMLRKDIELIEMAK